MFIVIAESSVRLINVAEESPVLSVEGADEGEGNGGNQDELTADAEQEVEHGVALPTYPPTKSEYDEYCVTHNPYRPWCGHCVECRAQDFRIFGDELENPAACRWLRLTTRESPTKAIL